MGWLLILFGGVISEQRTIISEATPAKVAGLLVLGAGINRLAANDGNRHLPSVQIRDIQFEPDLKTAIKAVIGAFFNQKWGDGLFRYTLSTDKYTILRTTRIRDGTIYAKTVIYGLPDLVAAVIDISYHRGTYLFRLTVHTKNCQFLTRVFGQRRLKQKLTAILSRLRGTYDDTAHLIDVLVAVFD